MLFEGDGRFRTQKPGPAQGVAEMGIGVGIFWFRG